MYVYNKHHVILTTDDDKIIVKVSRFRGNYPLAELRNFAFCPDEIVENAHEKDELSARTSSCQTWSEIRFRTSWLLRQTVRHCQCYTFVAKTYWSMSFNCHRSLFAQFKLKSVKSLFDELLHTCRSFRLNFLFGFYQQCRTHLIRSN